MKRFSISILGIISIVLLSLFVSGCNSKATRYIHLQGNAQGTTYSIKYEDVEDYTVEIDSIFKVIDASMSTYKPESLISRINKGDTTVVLDEHFIRVMELSRMVYEASGGLFDPTIGILVNAYGFGPEKVEVIDSLTLVKLLPFVGFSKVQVVQNHLVKTYPETTLDFNAIAQGYTVDVIGEFLESKNIRNYMVEIGGEVKAIGVNPDGKLWSIGVQNPDPNAEQALETIVYLDYQSVATSGNYRKFKVDANGKKYVHTINPITGKGEPSNLLSATVITEDCAMADAYATSLMVMGYDKSMEFLKIHPELEVFLIYVDAKGTTQTYTNIREKTGKL
jgi:thiamine biosynthesis lipoprotein